MAAAPAPQSPARRPRLLCEWKVTRDGTQGGHRPGPVPCALVATEPRQGLALRQSGVFVRDYHAVVHPHAAGPQIRVDPVARHARVTSACGRSQVALAAHRRAARCRRSVVLLPPHGVHALNEAACSP